MAETSSSSWLLALLSQCSYSVPKGHSIYIVSKGYERPHISVFLPTVTSLHPYLFFKEVGYLEASIEDRRQFLLVQPGSHKKHQILFLFIKQPLLSQGGKKQREDNHPTTLCGQELARFPGQGGKQICYFKRILQKEIFI